MYALSAIMTAHSADDLTLENKPTSVFDIPDLTHAERIACAACDVEVTQAVMRIAVNGHHRHSFPVGKDDVYAVGCFSLVPGSRLIGHFKMDFSGEDDGIWQTAFCATCGAHLGWYYQSSQGFGFFALILDRLKPLP